MENPCIECGGNCCWHEDCECRKVIPLSVIEDIKAEIKREEFTHHDGCNHFYMTPEEMKVILFEIIDKHISEKER